MKFSFEIIELDTLPEESYKSSSYPTSGVYRSKDNRTHLYFVDKEYGTVNTIYGQWSLYMTQEKDISEASVSEALVLKLIAASHGKLL
jgi:hypothetical protein